jgi:NAD(P)-dependent dehydrogenase (short-subunit alcohol dehydrogenase family)
MSKQQSTSSTVVITGASSGIGKASALHLDRLGFSVIASVRREEDAMTLRAEASERLSTILLDVTDPASLAAAIEVVTAAVEDVGLAGLVNNAGIAVAGPLEFLPVAELRRQLEVNLIGQLAVTQAFLPLLRKGRGRIVNVGSLSGKIAMPFVGSYSATKFAMESLTDSLRIELRPWRISVSLIEPGFTATPIWEKSNASAYDLFKTLPPQAEHLYGKAIPKIRTRYAYLGKNGTSPLAVAKSIAHALTSRQPKTRYAVGRGAVLGSAIFARLPDRLRDTLIARWLLC